MNHHNFIHSTAPCFIQEEGDKTRCDFVNEVQSLRARIHEHVKNTPSSVVLYHSNRFEFAVRLFALALEQCQVILPVNGQSKSLNEACSKAQFVIGEMPLDMPLPNLEHSKSTSKVGPFTWPNEGPLIFMTSGSTDTSKQIEKNWRHLNTELSQLSLTFVPSDESVVLSTVSHQHIYGLLFGLLWPLCAEQVILPQVVYPENAIVYLKQYTQVVMVSSPAFLSRLARDNVLTPYSHSIIAIYSSGGPLFDEDSTLLYSQLNVAITQVYGSTETGGIAYRQVDELPAAYWQCFQGVQIEVKADTKQILLTSPLVDAPQMPLDDCAEVNKDGTFRLLGRLDRTIKLEEKRINLTQMEQRCLKNPAIAECKIIVIGHQRTILGGVIVLSEAGNEIFETEGNRQFKRRLSAWLSDYYEHASLPRKWRIVGAMPYNEQGKLPQATLEALFV